MNRCRIAIYSHVAFSDAAAMQTLLQPALAKRISATGNDGGNAWGNSSAIDGGSCSQRLRALGGLRRHQRLRFRRVPEAGDGRARHRPRLFRLGARYQLAPHHLRLLRARLAARSLRHAPGHDPGPHPLRDLDRALFDDLARSGAHLSALRFRRPRLLRPIADPLCQFGSQWFDRGRGLALGVAWQASALASPSFRSFGLANRHLRLARRLYRPWYRRDGALRAAAGRGLLA